MEERKLKLCSDYELTKVIPNLSFMGKLCGAPFSEFVGTAKYQECIVPNAVCRSSMKYLQEGNRVMKKHIFSGPVPMDELMEVCE